MKTTDFVVVYDITNNKERRRTDKVLKGFGVRAQKSVFECKLNKSGKERLIQKLEALNLQTGFIKIYRLEYSFKKPVIGKFEGKDIDSGAAFVV